MSMAEKITYLETGEAKTQYTVCEEFIRIMHLVIDNEASKEEKEYFQKHINSSDDCLQHFDDEKSFRDFFKKKCTCVSANEDVIEQIKAKLASLENS